MRITMSLGRSRRGIAGAVLVTAAAASAAFAATPESGTVSPEEPKVTWEGAVTSSGIHHELWDVDPSGPECPQPMCDTFTLTVDGERQPLTIGLNLQALAADEMEGEGGIRVTKPDGGVTFVRGTSGPETTLRHRLRRAEPGEYVVDVTASYICCGEAPYQAFAEVPASAPAQPTPPATPGDPAPPELTARAGRRVSARTFRKRRRMPVTLESTGPVRDVRALLTRRRTRIAAARLASLEGRKRVTLRASKRAARRIRKGAYTLSVSGIDGQGRTVGSAVKVRIRR